MGKGTIILVEKNNPSNVREFKADHAEAILKLRNSAWMLPEDSPYTFNGNGIKSRRHNSSTKG